MNFLTTFLFTLFNAVDERKSSRQMGYASLFNKSEHFKESLGTIRVKYHAATITNKPHTCTLFRSKIISFTYHDTKRQASRNVALCRAIHLVILFT